MSSDIAIKVENLSKCYQIYEQPRDRLKQFVMPRLQRGLGKHPQQYYREFWALKDVSFEVKKGETVGIIGRNGSGKSTLLQIICGTLNPTGGTVTTHGRIAALLELGSGFNPDFTGRENVYLNASVLGLSNDEIDQRFDAIAAFADIGEFIEQPVKTYSSGMMVRLAFAVIAHVDADILVIDEALAVGDAFFTQKCMRFLRGFMDQGTVLFVSHDSGAVVNLCSNALLLRQGQVVDQGLPKTIVERYLTSVYESQQEIHGVKSNNSDSFLSVTTDNEYYDAREDFLRLSNLRNDIEFFKFDLDRPEFGNGDAKIIALQILDTENRPLSWVVGGSDVVMLIRCIAVQKVFQPIIGFHFKDRLGQVVFADNTFLSYQDQYVEIEAGVEFSARFEFKLPILPTGSYSISPAVAGGTQAVHTQHHWIHDAMIINVHASSVCLGLVGLSMNKINMKVGENALYG